MAWNAPQPYYYSNPNLSYGGSAPSLRVNTPSDDPMYSRFNQQVSNSMKYTSPGASGSLFGMPMAKALTGSKTDTAMNKVIGSVLGAFGMGKVKPEFVSGWETMPEYASTFPRLQQTSNFIQENLDRLKNNQLPNYYDYLQPQMYSDLSGSAVNRYYKGGAFDYGEGDTSLAMDQAALQKMTKSKGRSSTSAFNPLNQNFQDRGLSVSDLLTKMGVDSSYNATASMPQMSINMPRGPESQWVTYTPTKKKFNSGEKITYNTNRSQVFTQRPNQVNVSAFQSLF